MAMSWCPCAVSLPFNGDSVGFRLDDRATSMIGTYVNGFFHSRWSEYDVGRVLSWCTLDAVKSPARTLGQLPGTSLNPSCAL